jgi:crotonobetainyl-CoA:carnitine CoA-transferase CaiB-like acyl-CoA transferase
MALAALNPRLIYCAISGLALMARSGQAVLRHRDASLDRALSINGERGHMPVKMGSRSATWSAGCSGRWRSRRAARTHPTGRGRLIDISLYDGLIGMLGYFAQLAFITGEDPPPMGPAIPTRPLWQLSGLGRLDHHRGVVGELLGQLCDALTGRSSSNLRRDPTLRRDRRDEVDDLIAETPHRTVAEWQGGSPPSMFRTPGARRQRRVPTCMHWQMVGSGAPDGRPAAPRRTPDQISRRAAAPSTAPPTLGQHTVQVLRDELGFSEAQIAAAPRRRDRPTDRAHKRVNAERNKRRVLPLDHPKIGFRGLMSGGREPNHMTMLAAENRRHGETPIAV